MSSVYFLHLYHISCGRYSAGGAYNNWLYRSGLDPLSATNLCYVVLLTPYSFYHGYRIKNYTTNIYNITFINFYTIVIFPNKIFIRNIFFTFNPDMSLRFIKDFFPYNWEKLIHQKNINVS